MAKYSLLEIINQIQWGTIISFIFKLKNDILLVGMFFFQLLQIILVDVCKFSVFW